MAKTATTNGSSEVTEVEGNNPQNSGGWNDLFSALADFSKWLYVNFGTKQANQVQIKQMTQMIKKQQRWLLYAFGVGFASLLFTVYRLSD